MMDSIEMGSRFRDYISTIQNAWTQPTETMARHVEGAMRALFDRSAADEPWVRELLADQPARRRLYHDPDRGFMQMGHYHHAGHTSPPHDHGIAWVVYGVYQGELEISTYQRDGADADHPLRLLDRRILTDGVAYAYLPGAIHSTRCLSAGAVVLRFLSQDLNQIPRSHFRWEQIQSPRKEALS